MADERMADAIAAVVRAATRSSPSSEPGWFGRRSRATSAAATTRSAITPTPTRGLEDGRGYVVDIAPAT